MVVYPPAKINLGLYVVERRPDGYHNLETVFYAIPHHDIMEVEELRYSNMPYEFETNGIEIEGKADDNLVVKVYKHLQEEFQLPPVHISLNKKIPTGAGLGGGSSDAAYMMKALNSIFTLGLSESKMEEKMAMFGADCPFFIRHQPTFATGIGNIFAPIKLHLDGCFLVLVKPSISVSTKDAYSQICPKNPQYPLIETLEKEPIETWRNKIYNDFEKGVFLIHPEIALIKKNLYDLGALYASMSGSGSSVYALFDDMPPENEKLQELFNNSFIYQTRL